MKGRILIVFCLAWAMGMTAWGASEELGDAPEGFEIIELRAKVMAVAPDCSWVIVGETRFTIGSRSYGGEQFQTMCLSNTGETLRNACAFRLHDRVHAKGIMFEDQTILGVTIQKRDP